VIIHFGCQSEYEENIERYESGKVKFHTKLFKNNKLCETYYYENGNIKFEGCTINDSIIGKVFEYFDNGQLATFSDFSEVDFYRKKEFYYREGGLKAINLFSRDSLYYAKTISQDKKDSVDQIFPIFSFAKDEFKKWDTISISFMIPFDPNFPYFNKNLKIHYDLMEVQPNVEYPLPRKNNFQLSRNKQTHTIKISPKESGVFTFQGLITVGDEPLKHYKQNFFKKEFRVLD